MPRPPRIRAALSGLDRLPALLTTMGQLRRRLPGDPEFGDPLSTAGEPTLGYLVQGVAALSPGRGGDAGGGRATELRIAGGRLLTSYGKDTC